MNRTDDERKGVAQCVTCTGAADGPGQAAERKRRGRWQARRQGRAGLVLRPLGRLMGRAAALGGARR